MVQSAGNGAQEEAAVGWRKEGHLTGATLNVRIGYGHWKDLLASASLGSRDIYSIHFASNPSHCDQCNQTTAFRVHGNRGPVHGGQCVTLDFYSAFVYTRWSLPSAFCSNSAENDSGCEGRRECRQGVRRQTLHGPLQPRNAWSDPDP